MILVEKTTREKLEDAKIDYFALPDKGNRNKLVVALRAAFADSKSSFNVQEILNSVVRLSEVEAFKKEIDSGKRHWRNLAKVEIPLIDCIEELVPYKSSGYPQIIKIAKRRSSELKRQGKKQKT